MREHTIIKVEPGSIAEELEIEAGDVLISVNDQEIRDVFDYQYACESDYLEVLIRKPDGEEWLLEVEKDEDEELGLSFDESLMDQCHSCKNKCIFCFIDQNPKGMRKTIYFKDDDTRLSFLQGNYVTLTNLKDADVERIIRYRMEPINISVHTMNPELRVKMLKNPHSGEVLKYLKNFYEAGIQMNGQIVLCKGVNDGDELRFTIEQLKQYAPVMQSVSVVPVGLSKYRDGLYPLKPFEKEDAEEVIDIIESYQQEIYEQHGVHFIHASDEWYITAERDFPEEERYDGYLQIENGVGMMRSLITEVDEVLAKEKKTNLPARKVTIATGKSAFAAIREMAEKTAAKFPGIEVQVLWIRNDFFGERITVAGLITGQDLIAQLKAVDIGEELLIPRCMLRFGTETFLDDETVSGVEEALQTRVGIVESNGRDFVDAILGRERAQNNTVNPYEPEEG